MRFFTKHNFFLLFHFAVCLGILNTSAQTYRGSFHSLNIASEETSMVDERVLLNTDRDIYLCGEDIYFNAFIYDGNWFLPLSLSSVLYVELYNPDNAVIANGKYSVIDGRCSGIISIPKTIISNVYYIRAYTNYMKNFGIEQFFTHKLKIVNPFFELPESSSPAIDPKHINSLIHPEGGKLITGIKNRVGGRFTNSVDNGLQVTARLLDNDANVLSEFQSCKNGFAGFQFVPENDKKYSIEVIGELTDTIVPMPEASGTGATFSVDTVTSEAVKISIHSTDNSNFPLQLTARRGNFTYPLTETQVNSPGVYDIPAERIPRGLITLELTDASGNIAAGRLYYQELHKSLQISVKTDKEKYLNRENVELTIQTFNDKGVPVNAELAIYAFLTDSLSVKTSPYPDKEILGQELIQRYNFNHEFINNAISDSRLLDLLLLTTPPKVQEAHLATGPKLRYLPETSGDIISGRLTFKNNQPAKGIEVMQSFVGDATWIESYITDEEGRFYFISKKQGAKGDLILKVKNYRGEVFIFPDEEFSNEFPLPSEETLHLTKDEIDLISKKFINIQVEDAFRGERTESMSGSYFDTISFYGREYREYVFKDYVNLPNMKEFIHDIILGVTLSRENQADVINILEDITLRRIGPDPLVIVDGVPVSEASVVTGLSPEIIKLVRVVRYRFFYKDHIFDGIFDIITYNNDAYAFNLPENTNRFRFEPVRETIPVTGSVDMLNSEGRIPRYKNLLYWNSIAETNRDGKYTIKFSAPDNNGLYEIHCIGRAWDGNTGAARKFILVGE